MAAECELVLGLTRDAVTFGQDLGSFTHGQRPPVAHAVVDHPPPDRRRVEGRLSVRESSVGLLEHPGCAGHGLHAAGDDDVGVTCLLYTSPSPRDGLLSRMP